jgi:hypothetical protein
MIDSSLLSDALVGVPDPEIVDLEARLREAQLVADISAGTFQSTRVWARDLNATWRMVGGRVSLVAS